MIRTLLTIWMLASPVKWVYTVDPGLCNGCGNCLYSCPRNAITMVSGKAVIDPELCNGCGNCSYYCPRGAIYREWYTGIQDQTMRAGGFSLSGNPVLSSVLGISGASPGSQVMLTDLCGRVLSVSTVDSRGDAGIDLSGLNSGVYRIIAGEESRVFTII